MILPWKDLWNEVQMASVTSELIPQLTYTKQTLKVDPNRCHLKTGKRLNRWKKAPPLISSLLNRSQPVATDEETFKMNYKLDILNESPNLAH
ncbi:hypothetical protein PROFUN_16180 [Planoprotostelium fungivorum]|uniref:Uncharacterized protein n=1 Tax=Planoprotostelium fungivorum TaxID=1890364 RepID=A0A2P6MR30_9EUKA|nr:hypothetical protein PROFUN_16180 [Planoprotostelium fungivorum]